MPTNVLFAAKPERWPMYEAPLNAAFAEVGIEAHLATDIAPELVEETNGSAITLFAFEQTRLGAWFPYVLSVSIVLFAFSTMIAWSYYGLKGWTYLVGESRAADISFKAVFCLFIVIGCSIELSAVLDFSDALVFIICVPNILGLYLLTPTLKRKLESYTTRLDSGEIPNYREQDS